MERDDDKNKIIEKIFKHLKKERNTKKSNGEVKEKEYNEIEEKNKPKKTNNRQKKIYIRIICFFVLIGIMYFITKRYDNLVYPNMNLYDEDVSKLNENELNKIINETLDNINNNKFIIIVENQKYEIEVSDVIEKVDIEKTKNEIINYGKNKFFIEQFGLIYLNVDRNFIFDIKIDNDTLQEKAQYIYEDTSISAVEPSLEIKEDNIKIIKGKNGKGIDCEELVNKMIDAINSNEIGNNKISLKEEYIIIKPNINEKDLIGVKDKISTATTYFGGTGYNRGLNIVNATSKINGTLLMPGEEFSYEEKVSPVELYNGYYMAPVILNGKHENAPGGGVCQVSTTLYNAELKAGILPTERYNHSKPISYVQKGLDATLATGSKNLRFKNPYDYPIYIHAYTIGGQITVEFWSNKSVLGGKKYTPVSFVKGNVANTYLYGYNNKGKLVYKKFIDTSIYR